MELNPQAWPLRARVWLYKAGFSNDDIEGLGFYYNQRMDRVVMPVRRDGEVVYWQARGFDKERAKYMNPNVDRSNLVARFGTGPVLVLTEDVLSAFRVSRVTEAWALMGTSVPDGVLATLSAESRPVALMLDPDAAGMRARSKLRRQLGAAGVAVHILTPRRDPKLLSTEEIQSCLSRIQPTWPSV